MRRNTQRHTPEDSAAPTGGGRSIHKEKTAPPATVDQPANGKPQAANGKAGGKTPESTTATPVWEYLADPARDRDGTGTWLYRVWPVIDRKQGEHAICKKKGRFSREEILRDFGSGTYSVQVNDAKGRQLYLEPISFHHPDHPPRMDPLEVVVGDPRNDKYFQTWGKNANSTPSAAVKPDGTAAKGGETADIAEILRAHSEGSKLDPQVVSWLQDMANHRDDLAAKLAEASVKNPTADLASLISAVKSLMPAQTPAAADPLQIVEKILTIQNRGEIDIDKVWKLVERAQGRGEREPMQGMKDAVELFGSIKELLKSETPPVAAAAANPDDALWERIALNLSGQVGSLVSVIPAVISAIKGTPAPVLPQPTTPGATGRALTGFDPYRNPAAMRAYAEAQKAAANATPPQPTGAPQAGPAQPQPEAANGIAEIAGLIATALGCLNRGIDGHACAESIITLNGELSYESLVGQIKVVGVPTAVELAKAIPEVGPQATMFAEPLRKFITQFIEGPQWDEEESETKGAAA